MKLFTGLLVLSIFLLGSCGENPGADKKDSGNHLFTLLTPEQTGVTFQNTLTEGLNTNILVYEYFYNGGGVAAGDFNGDGLTDLYFTSNMSDNKLYLNKGKMQFQDITVASGAAGRSGPWKTGVNVVDINGDGKPDIYLCYSGAMPPEKRMNQLFINKGNNKEGIPLFEEKAQEYGLASTGFSNQSYFFDYDKDGDLDMLLLNHNPKNLPILNEASTAELFRKDNPEKGLRLFKQTNGRFEDITIAAGINGSELSYGLGLGISDFNNDGWPDFYVSNDYAVPDYLYINDKKGGFSNRLSDYIGHTSQFSMGNDVSDIDNDGLTDIYTLDMLPEDNHRQKLLLMPDNYAKFDLNVHLGFYYQYMRNMLQLNNGNETFSEVAQLAGISNTDWSWSALFADYDNDGWKDLFVTNGYFRDYTNLDFINYMNEYVERKGRLQREDVMEIIKEMPSSNVINYIFKNNKDRTFTDRNKDWGITQVSNSNGAVYADLDNDGDLDLVVNNINLPAFIYRNESQKDSANHFLQVSLSGNTGNTEGIGARIKIFNKDHLQVLEQNPARGYLSSVSSVLHFGLGKDDKVDSLLITWNSGKTQKLENIKADQVIHLSEKEAGNAPAIIQKSKPLFSETASSIKYTNPATEINDFNRQPLLISEFSYNSPCMKKADINGDGLDDILIGGTVGQATSLFVQQKNGLFIKKNTDAFEKDKSYEAADIAVFDANGDGKPDIYIASGGYHDFNTADTSLVDRLYINDGHGGFSKKEDVLPVYGSKSCVRVQDINGDGAPDLFIGGRVVPGRYPESPNSYVLINDGKGNFKDETPAVCSLISKIGMVTDAVWVDLDADKKNELVVAGEWMPVTVFKNENGKLINSTSQFFDKNYSGWWNTITVGDFNSDNKPDLIIGNMGLNTQFKASEKEPLELYYSDFDKNGSIDPVFSFYIQGKRYPYITRDELVSQMPLFKKRFSNFKSYADITLEDLFQNNELKDAGHLMADHMATTCFLSSPTGKYIVAQLPQEVQYSPVNTINTIDFNRDGKMDILLCGNNSHTKIRLGKFDANYGVLLAGDGKGNFHYVNQDISGFKLEGDIRSCVWINNRFYFGINGKSLVSYILSGNKN
ncbi:MAG: VCBS repeat-containing protein [Bacteroidetes bacterium]|nr:VCBS repeat-containing protein [Bacteroidota bacterium]